MANTNNNPEELYRLGDNGSAEAYDILYRNFSESVFSYAVRKGATETEAEFITAQTIEEGSQDPKVLAAGANTGKYLNRIASAKVDRLDPEPDEEEEYDEEDDKYTGELMLLPSGLTENDDDKALLAGIIGGLSAEQRTAVTAHFYDDKSLNSISRSTGVPVDTVRARIRLAKRYISDKIDMLAENGMVSDLKPVPVRFLIRETIDEPEFGEILDEPARVKGLAGKIVGAAAALLLLGAGIFAVFHFTKPATSKGDVRADSESSSASEKDNEKERLSDNSLTDQYFERNDDTSSETDTSSEKEKSDSKEDKKDSSSKKKDSSSDSSSKKNDQPNEETVVVIIDDGGEEEQTKSEREQNLDFIKAQDFSMATTVLIYDNSGSASFRRSGYLNNIDLYKNDDNSALIVEFDQHFPDSFSANMNVTFGRKFDFGDFSLTGKASQVDGSRYRLTFSMTDVSEKLLSLYDAYKSTGGGDDLVGFIENNGLLDGGLIKVGNLEPTIVDFMDDRCNYVNVIKRINNFYGGAANAEGYSAVVDKLAGDGGYDLNNAVCADLTDQGGSLYIRSDVAMLSYSVFTNPFIERAVSQVLPSNMQHTAGDPAEASDNAFRYIATNNISEVSVDDSSPYFTMIDGALYQKCGDELWLLWVTPQHYDVFVFPEGMVGYSKKAVVEIKADEFDFSNLDSIDDLDYLRYLLM